MEHLLTSLPDSVARALIGSGMDGDNDDAVVDSSPGSGAETPKAESTDAQLQATLQTYLDSLPYECENVEDMAAKLDLIVSRLVICAKARNWNMLSSWDSLLQWYITYLNNSHELILFQAGCSCATRSPAPCALVSSSSTISSSLCPAWNPASSAFGQT